jgi:hypothetical protein
MGPTAGVQKQKQDEAWITMECIAIPQSRYNVTGALATRADGPVGCGGGPDQKQETKKPSDDIGRDGWSELSRDLKRWLAGAIDNDGRVPNGGYRRHFRRLRQPHRRPSSSGR